MKFKAALFDFDGTLADTTDGLLGGVQYSLEQLYGVKLPFDEIGDYMGPPLPRSFARHGYPEKDLPQFLANYSKYYAVEGIRSVKFYPGAKETLAELKERGVRLAIASSKTKHVIEEILELQGMGDVFEVISAATDPGDATTKAVAIKRALDALGIEDAEEAVMVGDRYLDAEGAEAHGMPFIVCLFGGFGPREEFRPYHVDCFADSFPQVGEFILSE